MSESTIMYFAVFVFVMLMIGLGLTVMEFRYGQPRREDVRARKRDIADESTRPNHAAPPAVR